MDKLKTAPVIHDRPKMPRATWEALRNHIIRERKKKQDEEGKAEEYERLKKERENKKKQEANSLEETKDQISILEEKLASSKEEKHQLFLTLKKVLNEDETRRRKETNEMNILYPPQHSQIFPMSGHMAPNNPQLTAMYMQPQSRQPTMYLKPQGHPQSMAPTQQIKRQRTPSPPRPQLTAIPSAYYRSLPATVSGRIAASSVYGHPGPANGGPIYAMSSEGSGIPYPVHSSASQAREDERRQQVFLSHQAGARYVSSIHQQIEAAANARAVSDRDRARLSLVAPAAHAQPLSLTTTRAGSITSGFPVRTVAYPTTVPNIMTTSAHSLPPRLAYTQAAAALASQQAAGTR